MTPEAEKFRADTEATIKDTLSTIQGTFVKMKVWSSSNPTSIKECSDVNAEVQITCESEFYYLSHTTILLEDIFKVDGRVVFVGFKLNVGGSITFRISWV